jgi:hypothetical protein
MEKQSTGVETQPSGMHGNGLQAGQADKSKSDIDTTRKATPSSQRDVAARAFLALTSKTKGKSKGKPTKSSFTATKGQDKSKNVAPKQINDRVPIPSVDITMNVTAALPSEFNSSSELASMTVHNKAVVRGTKVNEALKVAGDGTAAPEAVDTEAASEKTNAAEPAVMPMTAKKNNVVSATIDEETVTGVHSTTFTPGAVKSSIVSQPTVLFGKDPSIDLVHKERTAQPTNAPLESSSCTAAINSSKYPRKEQSDERLAWGEGKPTEASVSPVVTTHQQLDNAHKRDADKPVQEEELPKKAQSYRPKAIPNDVLGFQSRYERT